MFSRVLKLPEMMVLLIVIAHGVLFVSAIFLCARKPNSTKTKQYAEGMVNPNSLSSRKSVRGSDSKHSSSKSLEKSIIFMILFLLILFVNLPVSNQGPLKTWLYVCFLVLCKILRTVTLTCLKSY